MRAIQSGYQAIRSLRVLAMLAGFVVALTPPLPGQVNIDQNWGQEVYRDEHSVVAGGPINDLCANSIAVFNGNTVFSTIGANTDGPTHVQCSSGGSSQINFDIWYHYTATCSGTALIETCGSQFNTKMAVYQSNGCLGMILDCNDGFEYCEDSLHAAVRVTVTQGQTYKIRVGGQNQASGEGTLFIQCGCQLDADCRDVFFCNGNERCDTGFCFPGPNPCSAIEVCDEGTQSCQPAPCSSNVECDDEVFCNGAEVCHELGLCLPGEVPCVAPCGCHEPTDSCTCPCPSGPMTFVDPESGTVDARQPHSINNPEPLFGIQTFHAMGPSGAFAPCWSLCESGDTGTPNSILSITDDDGAYTIMLARPITPNAVTKLIYDPGTGVPSSARFIAHPANVNGDSTASPLDPLRLIDCLNHVNKAITCPWGIHSCDTNRSGVCEPTDILRVIDLLNGASAFTPWNGTSLPSGCP